MAATPALAKTPGLVYVIGRSLYVSLTNRCNSVSLPSTRGKVWPPEARSDQWQGRDQSVVSLRRAESRGRTSQLRRVPSIHPMVA